MDVKSHMRKYDFENKQLHYLSSISSVKPRVDTGLPRSLALSQKRRDALARGRSKSAKVSGNQLAGPGKSTTKQSMPDAPEMYEDFLPPRSSTQNRFVNPLRSSYDPLDYHEQYFTTPRKPFTPRINSYVDGTSSALRHFKDAYDYEPPDDAKAADQKSASHRLTKTATAPAVYVPPLNINSNEDFPNSKATPPITRDEFNYNEWVEKRERQRRDKEAKQRLIEQSDLIVEEVRHSHDAEISKQNDEMAYLEFVRQVTDDVIRRNISSNSVIKQVFEWHIEQNKHRLDEARLREHMTLISRQLGLMDE